ncbi:MAG: zf-HC2 domain-containing protein [Deltaproteobacteria bacterium]|nr:zf-HC2 domain-containing protein [Deltaproteobacteria bacterium]MBN2673844.1 zf-HC2 domain-containing protein [Deltaproteobacteria bacterium]
MEHQEVKDLFTEYHDGDLSDEKKKELETHLQSCDECRTEWQAFEKTMNEISGLYHFAPPQDLAKNVEHKIHRRSRGKFFGKQKGNNIQFALISFILVLLFMLAYLMLTAVNEIIVLDDQAPDTAQPIDQ